MTARSLLPIFDSAYLLALTAWVGSILFFSFGVAPVIFPVLGAESGARFVRALFPRYYAWGVISGAIALPAYLGVPLSFPEYRGPLVAVQALAILAGILIMLYAGNTLTPAINAARDAGPAGQARFARLHRRAVVLNGLVLVLGLGLLIAHANRPAPRTAGILEMSPAERGRGRVVPPGQGDDPGARRERRPEAVPRGGDARTAPGARWSPLAELARGVVNSSV